MTAQQVPASSTVAVPHGPAGVGTARRQMCRELRESGVPETVVDDAALVLSELLSNAYRHARAWDEERQTVLAGWRTDAEGGLTIAVTDGGGPTRPQACAPSLSARGGRGLAIIGALARTWEVQDAEDAVTVRVVLPATSALGEALADSIAAVDLAAFDELH